MKKNILDKKIKNVLEKIRIAQKELEKYITTTPLGMATPKPLDGYGWKLAHDTARYWYIEFKILRTKKFGDMENISDLENKKKKLAVRIEHWKKREMYYGEENELD